MTPNAIKNDVRAGKTIAGAMVFEFFSPSMASILTNVAEVRQLRFGTGRC